MFRLVRKKLRYKRDYDEKLFEAVTIRRKVKKINSLKGINKRYPKLTLQNVQLNIIR